MVAASAVLDSLGFVVLGDFVPTSFCDSLIARAGTAAGGPATIYDGQNEERVSPDSRRTTQVPFEVAERDYLISRFRDELSTLGRRFDVLPTNLRSVNLLRYETGDFFRRHRDASPGKSSENRLLAFVLMISPDRTADRGGYEGGDFVFYPPELIARTGSFVGFNVRLAQGALAVFDAHNYHEVCVVTAGQRYTVVGWCE